MVITAAGVAGHLVKIAEIIMKAVFFKDRTMPISPSSLAARLQTPALPFHAGMSAALTAGAMAASIAPIKS